MLQKQKKKVFLISKYFIEYKTKSVHLHNLNYLKSNKDKIGIKNDGGTQFTNDTD
jgi:hypothetical protein